jgi:hypothetical protein
MAIKRGDIATCGLGRLGLITNEMPQWVTYKVCRRCLGGYDPLPQQNCTCEKGYTFVGVYLEPGVGNDGREYRIGDPWASRNPRVVGHIDSLLAESNVSQRILCGGCGWCLDCLRVERSRGFDHLPEGSH